MIGTIPSKVPGFPTLSALVLVRAVCRSVALNGTKIANKGLTTIPQTIQVPAHHPKAGNTPDKATSRSLVPLKISLLLRRFVFCIAEASAKRVTGDEPQGTMGRVQTAGGSACQILCRFLGKKVVFLHGPIFGLIVPYCCKHCKLWVDR